jgi:hypothetical protein
VFDGAASRLGEFSDREWVNRAAGLFDGDLSDLAGLHHLLHVLRVQLGPLEVA